MRFPRDRAVAHRAGRESLHDRRHRLDLVDRHGRAYAVTQREHAAKRLELTGLVVDELRVLAEDVVPTRAGGVLQTEDRVRVEEVRRAIPAPLVLATGPQALVRADR